jgi:hypothetical protein
MRSPIEQPEASDEPQLLVGGLWGAVAARGRQPWVEWSAERDESDGSTPTVVLGRE